MCGGGLGKKIFDIAAPLAGGALGGGLLGPVIGGLTGGVGGETIGTALGAGAGGAASGAGLKGSLLDAAGGAIAPNIGDIVSGISDGATSLSNTIKQATGLSSGDASAAASGATISPGATGGGVGGTTGAALPTIGGAPGSDALLNPDQTNFLSNAAAGNTVGGGGDGASVGATGLPTAAASSAPKSILDQIKGGLTLPNLLTGGGVIASALKGNSQSGAEKNLAANAATAGQVAAPLVNDLATGKLPPGAQANIDQLTQNSKNEIRSKFAQMGLSGSDMERQALSQADQDATRLAFDYANQATQTGLNALGASTTTYNNIASNTLQNDKDLAAALAAFASSSAGGTKTA